MDVLANDTKIEEGQPTQRVEVFPQQRHRTDDQAQQQHQAGCLGMTQLLDETRPPGGLRDRNVQLLIRVARRETFI